MGTLLLTNQYCMTVMSVKVSALSCPWKSDYISRENNAEEKGINSCYKLLIVCFNI